VFLAETRHYDATVIIVISFNRTEKHPAGQIRKKKKKKTKTVFFCLLFTNKNAA
jgi:hypothetical protein